ncbi:M60 family metallopeptidase [Mesorhizobium sp. M0435]|uniref:M60 family metallopeptidase n=1 Tax=Mesorhizobium sp. M0435 TaxID=2956944 RepID=UPI00333C8827
MGVPGSNMGDLLDVNKLRQAWSIWHETGHMYQQEDWTLGEIVETTVNICPSMPRRILAIRPA